MEQNAKKKISCGGFMLGEGLVLSEDGKTLSVSGGGGGGATTLHINVTAVNRETMEATFTADKTLSEMQQASVNGPIWCVVTFAAGVISAEALSLGIPPSMGAINTVAFGSVTLPVHDKNGENNVIFAVSGAPDGEWMIDLGAFAGD